VNRTADGRVPSAGLMIRTGRPRSNSFPEAESKSRTASAVAGRLPTWMMSSGFALSARSTMSAAVTSRIGEPSGPSDATPCRAFGFRTGQASARRRFRNHGGGITSTQPLNVRRLLQCALPTRFDAIQNRFNRGLRRRSLLDFALCKPRLLLIRKAARCAKRRSRAWHRAANPAFQWRHRDAQRHHPLPARAKTGGFAPPPLALLGGGAVSGRRVHDALPAAVLSLGRLR